MAAVIALLSGSTMLAFSPRLPVPAYHLRPPLMAQQPAMSTQMVPHSKWPAVQPRARSVRCQTSRLPVAVDTLKWRLSQLWVRTLALPILIVTALLSLVGSLVFVVADQVMRLVLELPRLSAQLMSAVVFLVTYPIWLIARGLSALGQEMKSAAGRSGAYATQLVERQGATPPPPQQQTSAPARPRAGVRQAPPSRAEANEEEESYSPDAGKILARQQMLERAKQAGGTKTLLRTVVTGGGLSDEKIAEMRARQKPIIRTGDPIPGASRVKTKAAGDAPANKPAAKETAPSPKTPAKPAATPPTPAAAPNPAARTVTMPSTTLPATVGEAKAQLGGTPPAGGPTVGNAKPSGSAGGQNKWLWRGATTPTAKAPPSTEGGDAKADA